MRYRGGKMRIGGRIARAVVADFGRQPQHVLELCCGSGGMTVQLADLAVSVTAVDAHPGLIALLRMVQRGDPLPRTVTFEEWERATDHSNPLHAFARFSRGYGGAWDGSWTPDAPPRRVRQSTGREFTLSEADPSASAARMLRKRRRPNVRYVCSDVLTYEPAPDVDLVFADPPYEGTLGYAGIARAEPWAFWRRFAELARRGLPVYLTEACEPPNGIRARLVYNYKPALQRMHAGDEDREELVWRLAA